MAKNFDNQNSRRTPRKGSDVKSASNRPTARKNSGTASDESGSVGTRSDSTENFTEKFSDSRDRSSGSRSLATRGNESGKSSSEWIGDIGSHSESLEQAVHEIIVARPLVTAAVAVGAGLVANLLWQKYGQSQSTGGNRSGKSTRKHVSTGVLSKNISSSLSRMESEFNSLAFGQFDEMRDGLSRLVVDDLKRRPFETLATAVGIGFGLANFDRRHLKQAGLKILKLAAVRALDSSGVRSETKSLNQTESKTGGNLYV